MYFITTKRMLEVCFSVHPNIQYRTFYIHGMDSMGQEYANKGGTAEVFRSFCPC